MTIKAERPISFTAESVRDILAGRKTQTRRVITRFRVFGDLVANKELQIYSVQDWLTKSSDPASHAVLCPYGQPGDRLWVKETWATPGNYDHIKPSDLSASIGQIAISYKATEKYPVYYSWRSPRFMPKWVARIWLELTEVRVERLQDITHEDVIAEGITDRLAFDASKLDGCWPDAHLFAFHRIWNKINAKRGYPWESNPWLWVLSFRAVKNK